MRFPSNSTDEGCSHRRFYAILESTFQQEGLYMNQSSIGLYIARKRREKNLTQEQLAGQLGVSNKTVAEILVGIGIIGKHMTGK